MNGSESGRLSHHFQYLSSVSVNIATLMYRCGASWLIPRSLFQSCAVAFIDKLDGPALNLSPEEFESYMLNQRAPSGGIKRQQTTSDTKHLLEELQGRQEKLHQGMDSLNVQLQNWVQAVHSQLDEATAQFALVQKEVTAQAALSNVFSSTSHDATPQGDDIDQSVVVLADLHAGPKDTDC